MALRPRELRLRLDDPALAPVLAFAECAYPGLPLQAAVREILLLGASAEPLNAALSATRLAAYRQYSSVARQTIAGALRELAAALELEEMIMRGG